MKAIALLTLLGVLGLVVLASFLLFGRARDDASPKPSAEPAVLAAGETGASSAEVTQLRGRLAALEARLQTLELELRDLRAGDRRAAATPGEEPAAMTKEEFVERYRQPVLDLITAARAEQAWLDRRIELGTWSYNLVSDLKLPKETAPDLKEFLIRESKPIFDLLWKSKDSRADPAVEREIREPLKAAQRTFYASLQGRFPQALADRVFLVIGMDNIYASRMTEEQFREALDKAQTSLR